MEGYKIPPSPHATRKHTAGEWTFNEEERVVECEASQVITKVYFADDFPCLEDDERDAFDEEAASNARLIAASPTMLEALKVVLCHIDANRPPTERLELLREQVSAAIAKAEDTPDEA